MQQRRRMAKFCAALSTRTRLIFAERDIEHPVHRILDTPMRAHGMRDACRIRRQAAHVIAALDRHRVTDLACGLDHCDRAHTRPERDRTPFAQQVADYAATRFDPAMIRLDISKLVDADCEIIGRVSGKWPPLDFGAFYRGRPI